MTARLAVSEEAWQRTVQDLLRALGWRSLHVRRTRGKGNRWTTATSVVGWPDLVAWRPGRIVGIELKSQRGRVTPEQTEVMASLAAAGVDCRVARPSDDFAELRAWLR